MTKTLQIEIRHTPKDDGPGTLPWLLARASHVLIGETSDGNQIARLKDHDGKTITVLAMRNYAAGEEDGYPVGPISLAEERPANEEHADYESEYTLFADREFTPAAWRVVKKIRDVAVEEMDRAAQDDGEDLVTVEVRRTADPTARQLADEAARDPRLLPVLRDRVADVG